ncbi:MAG TPA: carboxypeptidase-like regulatory domain-containing protein, partial [Hanamia sp.]|nr:carboxypeptidase-like regulatory domain-containing protein [Hanamia sp.]
MRLMVFIFFFFATLSSVAQNKVAYISGKVIDENETPMEGVSITILGKQNGVVTYDSGTYHIKVPA